MIYIGSDTTGGTGYLTRILKAALLNKSVHVTVLRGTHQERVYNTVYSQIELLNTVCTTGFNVYLHKE